ncbi:MAG: cell division protein ZipA C-terminal FtsZ-binding domain-containing protein [Paracoccaceae bacterium]
MDNLRWILLLLGLGLILAVYAVTRLQIKRREAAGKPTRRRPTAKNIDPLDVAGEDDVAVQAELAQMGSMLREESESHSAESNATGKRDNEQLIVLSVMASVDDPFKGQSLLRAFENTALQHSDVKIYQRNNEKGEPVYGVASAVKPGTFDLNRMDQFSTPGLSLFLQLPGPVDGVTAFDDMVTTAERLAVELGGELQDQNHSVLSRQMVAHIRDGIINARLQSSRAAP